MHKRVLILSDFNLWYGNNAGVVRMNNYAKSLSLSGVKVYLVSIHNFNEIDRFIEVENNIFTSPGNNSKLHSKKLYEKIILNFQYAKSISNFEKKTKVEKERVYIIYPSTYSSFEFFNYLFIKKLEKAKLFYELNEVRKLSLEKPQKKNSRKYLSWIIQLTKFRLIENLWGKYDGLICISDNIAQYAGNCNENKLLIPILADIKSIRNENKPSSNNEFNMFFSGFISIRKENLEEFFKGLILFDKICKKWKFELCGPFEGNDKNILLKIIKENNLEHKIIFLGNLPHSEVLRKQQEASLLVLTRGNNKQNYYGFSTKLAEYAVSGTPILLTKTGVVTDFFIDNENCYLVNGYNSQSFFEGLEKIFNSTEEQRNKIAENALKTAKINFDYHNYTEKLENFLFK